MEINIYNPNPISVEKVLYELREGGTKMIIANSKNLQFLHRLMIFQLVKYLFCVLFYFRFAHFFFLCSIVFFCFLRKILLIAFLIKNFALL